MVFSRAGAWAKELASGRVGRVPALAWWHLAEESFNYFVEIVKEKKSVTKFNHTQRCTQQKQRNPGTQPGELNVEIDHVTGIESTWYPAFSQSDNIHLAPI